MPFAQSVDIISLQYSILHMYPVACVHTLARVWAVLGLRLFSVCVCFFTFRVSLCVISLGRYASGCPYRRAVDCLKGLVIEMTCFVLSGTLNTAYRPNVVLAGWLIPSLAMVIVDDLRQAYSPGLGSTFVVDHRNKMLDITRSTGWPLWLIKPHRRTNSLTSLQFDVICCTSVYDCERCSEGLWLGIILGLGLVVG